MDTLSNSSLSIVLSHNTTGTCHTVGSSAPELAVGHAAISVQGQSLTLLTFECCREPSKELMQNGAPLLPNRHIKGISEYAQESTELSNSGDTT